MSLEIKELENLLLPFLGEHRFVKADINKLTVAGDNYGSIILAVDITVRSKTEKENVVHAVAKLIPSNKIIQEMFNTPYTFRNEIELYRTIAPCLKDFQKKQGLSSLLGFVPDYFTSRMNLDPSKGNNIDEDAALLIKNIKYEGYAMIEKTVGFDLDQTRLILSKIAEFHAAALALKTLQPGIFNQKLAPFLQEYEVFVFDEDTLDDMIESIIVVVKNDEICSKHLAKIRMVLYTCVNNISKKNSKKFQDRSIVGLVHGDLWTNNIMVKVVDHKTTDIKFVDYQLYEYTCLAREIIFFLFTSVQISVLGKHCDSLFVHYYDSLIYWLTKLKCETSQFNFGLFMDDVKVVLQEAEFLNILYMLAPIHAGAEVVKEVEEVKVETLTHFKNSVTKAHKDKACFLVRMFLQKKWI